MLTPNCPVCGTKTNREVGERNVGPLLGLRSVVVTNLPAFVCPQGHDAVISGKDLREITLRLAATMTRDIDRLGGYEVRYLRKYIQETQEEFAKRLGTSRAAVSKWEKDLVKELDPITSYAIRSAVASVLNQRAKKKKLDLEPYALRDEAHRRRNEYRVDI
jgi:YgiT-type zinc finger domain-containing protein